MLQSEFYDRTKVNLTGEEYAEVERIYNAVKMNKDEFCKQWKKVGNSQLVKELMEELETTRKNLDRAIQNSVELSDELDKREEFNAREILKHRKNAQQHLEQLGKDIVLALGNEARLYEVLDEEFTMDFIVRVKLEEGLPLDENERKYLVERLKHS